MPPKSVPPTATAKRHAGGKKCVKGTSYIRGDPKSYSRFLKDNITDAAIGRMKLLAGGPRIQMSIPEGATGPGRTSAAQELRAFAMAIIRTLVNDTVCYTAIARRRLIKVDDFKAALAAVRGRRYYY
jgi:histone H3/H4